MAGMSEAEWSDLYNGLSEVLGPDRADVLMAQLPRFDPAEVATKSDLAALRSDTRSDITEMRGELGGGPGAVDQRLDRLSLALLVGGGVAAMVGRILSFA